MTARNLKRQRRRNGDPGLIDRLTRAIGYHQQKTGNRLTDKDLGEMCGLKPSTMTAIMTAERAVKIPEAAIWSRALGVCFEWLCLGVGEMECPEIRQEPEVAVSAASARAVAKGGVSAGDQSRPTIVRDDRRHGPQKGSPRQ